MTHRFVGLTCALVASLLACATPDKYRPTDADPVTSSTDAAPLLGADAPGLAPADAPATAPASDAAADLAPFDTASSPPDGPCGTPTDPRNCGTCGHDCTKLTNVNPAMVTCQVGKCVVPASACAAGYAHCSSNVEDGCEASLARQETCGGCNMKCSPGELCAATGGAYQCVSACSGGTPDKCGGACANLQTDPRNCGSCGRDCSQLANVKPGASVSCQGGHCVIPASSCTAGYGHCGSGPADSGCETNVSAPQTCGCTACKTGEVCTSSAGSYQCTCGGNMPTRCGSSCADLQTDVQNCGRCGHSCLGGTCGGGACQPVQIYKGSDFSPESFTVDGSYIYFKRIRSGGIYVLARMPKDGGSIVDLTSVDEGSGRVALANGVLYWAKGNQLSGCSAPACSSPVVIPNQMNASTATASSDHSRLFWGRIGISGSVEIVTNPSSPAVHGTMPTGVSINDMSARGNDVYVSDGNTAYRATGGGGAAVTIGPGGFRLVANSQSVFFIDIVMVGTDMLAGLKKYSIASIGSPQAAATVGTATGALGGFYGLVVDDSDAYWLVGSDTDVSMRLLHCPVSGCLGTAPELAHTPVTFPDGTLVGDGTALYWGTQDGVFKIAR